MDLFLRADIAAYKATESFQKLQDAVAAIFDKFRNGMPSPKSQRALKAWLKFVDFCLLPKSVALLSTHETQSPATDAEPYLFSRKRIVQTRVFNVA